MDDNTVAATASAVKQAYDIADNAIPKSWRGDTNDTKVATLNSDSKVNAAQASSKIVSVTSSKTLDSTYAGTLVQVNSSSAITITVPTNASKPIAVGTEIEVCRWGSGTVTFSASSGVTVNSVGSAMSIADQYGCAVLKKMDTNVWLLAGDLG